MFRFFASYPFAIGVLVLLGCGAAVATFIENDFGSNTARFYVYNALWYEALLVAASFNILLVMYQTRMLQQYSKFLFHGAFVVILVGAGLTRYYGIDGVMKIREGSSSKTLFSIQLNQEITLPFSVHLENFEMERYYGSKAPSEYASHVIIKEDSKSVEATISMNKTLSYKGYKFFQTFYDPDEKGTILSVTKPRHGDNVCGIRTLVFGVNFKSF